MALSDCAEGAAANSRPATTTERTPAVTDSEARTQNLLRGNTTQLGATSGYGQARREQRAAPIQFATMRKRADAAPAFQPDESAAINGMIETVSSHDAPFT